MEKFRVSEASLRERNDSLVEYESTKEMTDIEEGMDSDVIVHETVEDDLNASIDLIRAQEKEAEMNANETRALVVLRNSIKALVGLQKIRALRREAGMGITAGKGDTQKSEMDEEEELKNKIADLHYFFNAFNGKRKAARKAREERVRKKARLQEEKLKESFQKELAEVKRNLASEQGKQDNRYESKEDKQTQTELIPAGGERKNAKRKERSPDQKAEAKRKSRRTGRETSEEETWVQVTKRGRQRAVRKRGRLSTAGEDETEQEKEKEKDKDKGKQISKEEGVVRKAGKKADDKKEVMQRWRPPVKKSSAVEIKIAPEKSFAEAVKRVRNAIPKEDFQGVKTVRRTRNGNVLIELNQDTINVDDIRDKVATGMDEDFQVWNLKPKREFEIRNIDVTVDKEEFVEAIVDELKEETTPVPALKNEIIVKTLRTTYKGTKIGVVILGQKWAEKLVQKASLRIRYTSCRVTEVPRISRCINCQGVGHSAAQCKEKRTDRCCRCGETDHDGRSCTKEMRCFICAQENTDRSCNLAHIAGSYRCPAYQRELKKALEGPNGSSRKNN